MVLRSVAQLCAQFLRRLDGANDQNDSSMNHERQLSGSHQCC